jgi:frataxin-like iron-binding protein CyaY
MNLKYATSKILLGEKISFQFVKKFYKLFSNQNPNNPKSVQDRLDSRTKNVGSNAEQIQNYERSILLKHRVNELSHDLSLDIDELISNSESTNIKLMENINNPSQQTLKVKTISYSDYLELSDKMMKNLKNAFEDLSLSDSNILIEADNKTPYNLAMKINVKGQGVYIIAKELETRSINVTSPLTGLFKYSYDPISKYWKSLKDGHIMDELLMREFCKHSKGLLIINN